MARYVSQGNTFPIKDLFKIHGFTWYAKDKVWVRQDKRYDISGDITEEAVLKLRKAIKESGFEADVVFIGDSFTPGENP